MLVTRDKVLPRIDITPGRGPKARIGPPPGQRARPRGRTIPSASESQTSVLSLIRTGAGRLNQCMNQNLIQILKPAPLHVLTLIFNNTITLS